MEGGAAMESQSDYDGDNVVRLEILGADDRSAESSWPATTILPLACLTGAAIWSLFIFAGMRLL